MEENNTISLKEIIKKSQQFIKGEITSEEFAAFGNEIDIRTYLPIFEKLNIMMAVTQEMLYSNIESQEIKIVELYKNKFFKGLLRYTNIDIEESDMQTYENYDLLYSLLSDFILQYCEKDYKMLDKMIDDALNLYTISEMNNTLESIDYEKMKENTESNKEFIDGLKENKKLVKDLKDIMEFNDPFTKKLVEETKKLSLQEANDLLRDKKAKKETKSSSKSKTANKKVVNISEVKIGEKERK